MAFVRLAFFPSATRDHFEALAQRLPPDAPTERLLFAAGPAHGGWQVVQLWQSRTGLDRFNEAAFFPALDALGRGALPPPQVLDFEPAMLSLTPPAARPSRGTRAGSSGADQVPGY